MGRRVRRWSAVLAAAGVLVASAACSSSSPSGNGAVSSSGGAKAGETLTVWTWRPEDVPGLQAVANIFTKQTGMKVTFQTSTSDASYATKIEAAARTGGLPDVLMSNLGIGGDGDWTLAQSGLLQELTPDFTGAWKAEVSPFALQSQQLTAAAIKASGTGTNSISNLKAGQIWGVPIMAGSAGFIFARKSMLSQAGVDTTTPPATWAQFVSDVTATQGKLGSKGGIVTGLQVPETGYFWAYEPLAWAYLGPTAYDARFGANPSSATSWTSTGSVQTLSLYNQLSKLWIPGSLSLGITQADAAFSSGKAAWDLGGTFTLGGLIGNGVPENDIMAFPLPAASGGKISNLQFSAGALVDATIPKSAQYPAAALQFIKLMSSPQGALAFAKGAGTIPATVLSSSQLAQLPPQISAMYKGLTNSLTAGYNGNEESVLDPATNTPVGNQASVIVAGLASGASTPAGVATKISSLYSSAWKFVGK